MKRTNNGNPKSQNSDSEKDIFGREVESKGVWQAEGNGNLLIYTPNDIKHGSKIAAFDMDGTLISTKSGKVFPVNYADWRLWDEKVSVELNKLHDDGFKLVIFTNQKGLEKGHVEKSEFKKKIQAILKKIRLPIQVFISVGSGCYRKPSIGMWKALLSNNGDEDVDMETSFYVGDAAGRHKTKLRPKKDHSSADRFFASNVGLNFKTPEQFFLKKAEDEPWGPPSFEPKQLLESKLSQFIPEDTTLSEKDVEMIVMVGFPASGKSTFTKKLEKDHGYAIVSRDVLGDWKKCVAAARNHLESGRRVVVDNTSPDKDTRSRYVKLAKELSIHVRCFEMNCSLAQAVHNNRYRSILNPQAVNVSIMVLRMYNKNYEKPELTEGFDSIVSVNFVPSFDNDDDRRLYSMYLTE